MEEEKEAKVDEEKEEEKEEEHEEHEEEHEEEESHVSIDGPETAFTHSDNEETEEEDDQINLPTPDLIDHAHGSQRQYRLSSVQDTESPASALSCLSIDAPQTIDSQHLGMVAIGTSRPQLSSLQRRPEHNLIIPTSQLPTRQSRYIPGEQTSISEGSYETPSMSIQENSPYCPKDQGYEEFVPNSPFSPTRLCFRSREYPREYCNDVTTYRGRLATFYDWSCDVIDAETLARDGFYYEGNGDEVYCFGCRGTVHRWRQGDIPRREHFRIFMRNCL